MIQNIAIDKISPHYDNPRKDLGDITELAESIKNSGIFQNLTVVPWFSKLTGVGCEDPNQQEEMGYIVVIGHRRLAAAKLAGLTEVPCAISNMNYRDQIATMLLENMQRSDLTIYEQAEGFQMMLDLGESVDGISQKTGFSETTVRRRVKLLDLDKDKFKKSVERGATLMDYVELEKIKDIEQRNKVLETIGTSNFKWNLQNALEQEKREENKALTIAFLEKFATKIEQSDSSLRYVMSYSSSRKNDITVPDDADTAEYFFTVPQYGEPTLYRKLTERDSTDDEQTSNAKKREEEREHCAALAKLADDAYKLRYDFLINVSNAAAKKNINAIVRYFFKTMFKTGSYYFTMPTAKLSEIINNNKLDEDVKPTFDGIKENIENQPERSLLVGIYLLNDSQSMNYHNYKGQHEPREALTATYEILTELGYEMSDEEIALQNGTHELFIAEEKE